MREFDRMVDVGRGFLVLAPLVAVFVRRELKRRVSNTTVEVITRDRIIKQKMDTLSSRDVRDSDVSDLLMWLYDVCSTVEA